MQPNQDPQASNQTYQKQPPLPPQAPIQNTQQVQLVTLANEWAYIGFILSFNPYVALFSLIFSILGYKASRDYEGEPGKRFAIVGIINSCFGIVVAIFLIIFAILPLVLANR